MILTRNGGVNPIMFPWGYSLPWAMPGRSVERGAFLALEEYEKVGKPKCTAKGIAAKSTR